MSDEIESRPRTGVAELGGVHEVGGRVVRAVRDVAGP